MKNLMHEIACSNIRIIELKLKRLSICKEELLNSKPSRLNVKKLKKWENKIKLIEEEEKNILEELQKAYIDYEKFLH